jgi:predicted oxidoreductase (fatty acid repression mutant protein)
MAYREYKRYLTDHEYINLYAMRKALGKIRKQLDENKLQILEHQKKIVEKNPTDCNLYSRDMLMILGKERRMLKDTRQKIERLIDKIVKKAQRRMEDMKRLELKSLEEM